MKRVFLFVIISVLAFSPLFAAETKTKVVETKGHGVNRDEAINMALTTAPPRPISKEQRPAKESSSTL
jgi:hypothetical protein